MKTNHDIHIDIEPLECRIAPAAIYTFLDVDGDTVTIKSSKGDNSDFTTLMEAHRVVQGSGYRINEIDLTDVVPAKNGEFANTALTVSVARGAHGDGRVDLGYINATGLPLQSLLAPKASIQDLDCGDGSHAIGTLQVASYGTAAPGYFNNGIADQLGVLSGSVGSIKIAGDIAYGGLQVYNGAMGAPITVGSIFVGGNLNGAVSAATQHAGQLFVFAKTGSIQIGGSVIGGSFNGGFLIAPFNGAGELVASASSVSIGGDIVGGAGGDSGLVYAGAKNITVHGSVIGGSGTDSGFVYADAPSSLVIGGNVQGGTNTGAGLVSGTSAKSILIKGSVIGGVSDTSGMDRSSAGGVVFLKDVGTLTIGGNLIAGSVTAGNYNFNGSIDIGGNVQSIHIGGSVLGSDANRALILVKGTTPAKPDVSFNAIGSLTIHGSVEYSLIASGHDSEQPVGSTPTSILNLGDALNPDAGIGSVTIGGDFYHTSILAGTNDNNGQGAGRFNGNTNYDTQSIGDASRIAQLGPVVIKGGILDDYSSGGFSGFEAERITSITAGGTLLFKHGDGLAFFDPNRFTFAQEIPVT